MECKFCQGPASYTLKNGSLCCRPHHMSCPAIKSKAGSRSGATRTGLRHSDDHRRKNGEAGVGRTVSRETRDKISESNKNTRALHPRDPWNKGRRGSQQAWNKGHRKREPMAILECDDPAYFDIKKYRNRVSARTRRVYRENKEELNPFNLPLGKCGIEGAHQIDHIISVREGFEKRIPVEIISAKENLRIIPWLENLRKYDGTRA